MRFFCSLILMLVLLPTAVLAQDQNESEQPAQQRFSAEALIKEATLEFKNEQFQSAYQKARLARTISQRRGAKAREAKATNWMALSAMSLGRVTEAIPLFKQASALMRRAGSTEINRRIQINALERAGRLSRLIGNYEDALWCLEQTLELLRQTNNRVGTAMTLSNISAVYADTGDFAKATQTLDEALTLARNLRDKVLEKQILLRRLVVEKGRDNLPTARDFGEQALAIQLPPLSESATKKALLALIELHYQLGQVYAQLNQHEKALALYQQAMQRSRNVHIPQVLAFVYGEMAWSQLKTNAAADAIATAEQAFAALKQGGGNKHFASRIFYIRAEAHRALGQNAQALQSYRAAITALEEARALSIPTEISRAGIVASRHNVFADAIDFLLSQDNTAEALEIAETYHARAFLDVLAETGIKAEQPLNPAQKEEEENCFANIVNIQKELWQADLTPEIEQRLNTKLGDAERALESFQAKIRRATPRYASAHAPPLLKANALTENFLDNNTALIEFVVGEKKSFAWIIHRGTINAVTLPDGKIIENLVSQYRESFNGKINALTAQQAIVKQKSQAQILYQTIFQPLESHLATAKKIVIVPDGALAYLPFETLAANTTAPYLLEKFALSYAPSASALAALRTIKSEAKTSATGIIAFGDPFYGNNENQTATVRSNNFDLKQLPYTRTEVNAIAALFPVAERRVLLGANALEENVKAEPLHNFRYVHFAAHSSVDEENPARSGIVLSMQPDSKEDGVLQMSEVMRLKLNADLVTLSACRTALGKLLHGEGMIGLTRAFLYAGANSVVVSYWNVDDIATASLMKEFYQHLQNGTPKDEALRQAKLSLLNSDKRAWRHPYYWAAFVLIGEN